MKHGKLFAKIIYYVFTFSIGILLALFLPYIYMSDGEFLKIMDTSLKNGKYSDAMLLVGGYFDKQAVFQQDFDDGGGIVLFSAATLVYGNDDKVVDESQLHKSYAGFAYNLKNKYNLTSQDGNQSKLIVTNADGNTHTVELLDSDLNGDGQKDTNATFYRSGFFYIDLDLETFSSLRKLSFIDKDGNVYKECSLNLNYEEQFFTDAEAFIEEYNRDYKSERLSALNKELLEKSESYAISSMGVAQSRADKKAAIVVVVYFVSVYIVADFIVGQHFIIKFFKWFLFKVCKIKVKPRKTRRSEVFGNDYYSQVTFKLDIEGLEDFAESVQIRYTDEKGEEIAFILLKEQNYTATQRIKAGTYVNLWIDIDKSVYGTQDLPETLEVEGYQKTFNVKIIRREENTL